MSLCAQIPSFLGVISLALCILDEFITSIVNESDDAYSSRQNTIASHTYLCQLKTCSLLGKAVQGLSAAGSAPGCVTDQQDDFGRDRILSSLYSLPFYLFKLFFFFGHQLSFQLSLMLLVLP